MLTNSINSGSIKNMDRFKSPIILLSLSILVFSVVLSTASVVMKAPSQPPRAASKAALSVPGKTVLRNSVKSAFPSKEEIGILAYLDLSFSQEKPLQSYLYIKKAFDKMKSSYKLAKTSDKKLAMNQLKSYADTLPNYKESDFVIPK